MTRDSIDFQPLSQETDIPVRKSFRVPVSEKDNIRAVFGDKSFFVANISLTGIAIHSESCLEFEDGEILESSRLWLGSTCLEGLTGKVVHCSVHASGQLQFGIEWQGMDAETRALLENALKAIKAQALKDDGLAKDEKQE